MELLLGLAVFVFAFIIIIGVDVVGAFFDSERIPLVTRVILGTLLILLLASAVGALIMHA